MNSKPSFESLSRLPSQSQMVAAIRAELTRREAEEARARVERDAIGIRARCSTLAGFVREAWTVLEPNTPYVHGWHIDVICEHLEAITYGRFLEMGLPNRLLINVPPGTMKSLLVSVFWPAWEWTTRPAIRYLTASYSEDYAKRDSRRMRDLVQSAWYQALWPDVKLIRAGELSFENTSRGGREGKPFASLTGGRGDRVILDDPHSTETAESEADRATTTRIFRESLTSRLNDPKSSAIVVIMQRLHEEDVSGVIVKQRMPYVHLMLPMEFEPERACSTVLGFRDPRSYAGDLLMPDRFSRDVVERDKVIMGPYAYAGQYQQRPAPRDGAFFEKGWFPRYRQGDVPKHVRIYLSSDHAPTAGPKSDANGCRVWGVAPDGDLWMLGGRKGRMRMDELAELVVGNVEDHKRAKREGRVLMRNNLPVPELEGLIRRWQPFAWFPENDNNWKAVEPFVVRRMREEGVHCRIEPISPNGQDKATRAQSAQAMAAMGRIHIPDTPEGDEAIQELISFPTAEHDEEVDLLSIMCRAIAMAHPAIVPPEPKKDEAPRGINEMTFNEAIEQAFQPKMDRV